MKSSQLQGSTDERALRTADAAALLHEESRMRTEQQLREAMEYHALMAHGAAAQYQRDMASFVIARCSESDPRVRALLADVEHALRSASDTARASGDLAAAMVDHARAIATAYAALQARVTDDAH